MKVAYFGTDGCVGHKAIPISGEFTHSQLRLIERIDCADFGRVFNQYKPKIATFKEFTVYGFPASPDDDRPGSKTVVLIQGNATEVDFIRIIKANYFLKQQFSKLFTKYNIGHCVI